MRADRNRLAMLRFYDAINAHDLEAVADCLAADSIAHGIPARLGPTREGYLQFVQTAFEAFPDLRYEALDVIADRAWVAARYRNTGTHEAAFMGIPATGRPVRLSGGDFCRFDDDGRIVAHWAYTDNLELLQQLGVLAEDTLG